MSTSLKSYDELNAWAGDKCTPLVREITFENAEELVSKTYNSKFHHQMAIAERAVKFLTQSHTAYIGCY